MNQSNIYQYVRRYAEHRMITAQEKALKNIRDGEELAALKGQQREMVFLTIPSYPQDRE